MGNSDSGNKLGRPPVYRRLGRPPAGAAGIALCLASLLAHAQGPAVRPLWITQPKSDDSVYLYRVGEASEQASPELARIAALDNARRLIAREILLRAGVDEKDHFLFAPRLAITRMEPVPGAWVFEDTGGGRYAGWIQVSMPLTERNELVKAAIEHQAGLVEARQAQEKLDQALNGAWQAARAAAVRGEYQQALEQLREPLARYAEIQQPDFALEEAQLLLADTHWQMKNQVEARTAYETVARLSASPEWRAKAQQALDALPQPPRAWPLRGRFGDRSILLVCALQHDHQPATPFFPLSSALSRDFSEVSLKHMDGNNPAAAQAAGEFVQSHQLQLLLDQSAARQAGAALVVLVCYDSSLKGKTQDVAGAAIPTPDVTIHAAVIDALDGTVVYRDSFREISGTQSESRMAERISTILLTRYLLPKCPALAAGATFHSKEL